MAPSDHPNSRRSRRCILASLGTASIAGLDGCLGDLDDSGGDDLPQPTATSTRTDHETETDDETDRATATPTESPGETWTEGGPPDREGWTVTFQDTFDQGALDGETWTIGAWSDTPCAGDGPVDVCFVEDHVAVDQDMDRLVLEASSETPTPPPDARPAERNNEFSVGAVTTKHSFAQQFGYFEVAARIPDQPGTLPAAWLFCDPTRYDWREIEVFEKPGADPVTSVKMGGWFERDADGPDGADELTDNEDRDYIAATGEDGLVDVGNPVDEAFHVYGLEWGPDSLAWYVDGERVGRNTDPGIAEHLPGQPLYWILNHNVYEPAPWVGDRAEATFPNAVTFEWVRTWQRDDWA